MSDLTHLGPDGRAEMVDVSDKDVTLRRAVALAPTTPPAGPDSTVRTGSRAAVASVVMPPLDCMTKIEFLVALAG